MYFYLLTIAYDGSDFAGWAKQPNKFTGQGYIEDVLRKIFSRPINILASSRTDKGVHAREQKFTLRLPFFLTKKNLLNILQKTSVSIFWLKKFKEWTAIFIL